MNTMPTLFIGHGSPMNALEDNKFTQKWREIATNLPNPEAILCISAHWYMHAPTTITTASKLNTIHDFYGFPKQLFEVNYTPPGNLNLCNDIINLVHTTVIKHDDQYGIDHGVWSILKHMYPNASIPVIQLSIDSSKPPLWHYMLGKQLQPLRNRNILILGSGNIVHNLNEIDWHNSNGGYPWARTAQTKINELIIKRDFTSLCNYHLLGSEVMQAIPTPDHFIPLLYILGLADINDNITLFNDELIMGSLSMTSVTIESLHKARQRTKT